MTSPRDKLAEDALVTGLMAPRHVAVTAVYVYFKEGPSVFRVRGQVARLHRSPHPSLLT